MIIKSLSPRNGPNLPIGRVTVLVGPNDAGKTETLRDIYRLVSRSEPEKDAPNGADPQTRLLEDLDYQQHLKRSRLLRGLQTTPVPNAVDELIAQGLGPDLSSAMELHLPPETWNVLQRPRLSARAVWKAELAKMLPLRVAMLGPENALRLIAACNACSTLDAPHTALQALELADPVKRQELDDAFHTFSRQHLMLDNSQRVRLSLRVADHVPDLPAAPAEAARLLQQYRGIEQTGLGLQMCAAIALAILLGEGRVVLLDKPETYLHPVEAFRLGRWLGRQAEALDCQLVLATHSPRLLAGLVAASHDVTVLRFSRQDEHTSIHAIPAAVTRELAESPLASIQPVLDCIFHRGVVVTRADADRAVYQTTAGTLFDTEDLIFIQAYGRRNLAYVMKLMRSAQIPVAVISDFDILESRPLFLELVEIATGQPPQRGWVNTRDKLAAVVEGRLPRGMATPAANESQPLRDLTWGHHETPPAGAGSGSATPAGSQRWAIVRTRGLEALPEDLRPWVADIIDELSPHGVFIVPGGDLASWMELDVSRERKEEWFVRAVHEIQNGNCPQKLATFLRDIADNISQRCQ